MRLGAVVPCTDNKVGKSVVAAVRELGPASSTTEAARRWHDVLGSASPSCTAGDLYRGPGWVASQRLVEAVSDVGSCVDWRIISAGYGLLHPSDEVTNYSATFLPGHADSVPGPSDIWWDQINQLRGQSQALEGMAGTVDGLIVAASASYVDAVAPDLAAAARLVPTVVFCTGRPRDAEIAALAPRFDRRLREGDDPFVRGGDLGFNQRVATRTIEILGPAVIDRSLVGELLADAMDREGPVRHARQQVGDGAVMSFIADVLDSDPSASKTALLRRWRDRGCACEQKRFGALYERVVSERDGQSTVGEEVRG